MYWRNGIALLGVGLLTVACSKNLSKERAREIIQSYYDKDDNAYCTWAEAEKSGTEAKRFTIAHRDDRDLQICIDDLVKAGVIKQEKCVRPGSYSCMAWSYATVRVGDSIESDGARFACGKKILGEVLSISTEGKKASVKYQRRITKDLGPLTSAVLCTFKEPTPGEEEQTMKMKQDDDGNWSPDY